MPIFHHLDRRVKVHGFLCVMSLLFYRWVQMRAEERMGSRIPIDRLAALLDDVRVAAVTDSKQGRARFVLETVKDERRELVDALQLRRFVPN